MNLIPSFTIDHNKLLPGLYVSRKDEKEGVTVTTFDLRVTAPNREEVMTTGAIHTIEHIVATYLRNSRIADSVVYFGPMGCRTGFYLVLFGDLTSVDVLPIVKEAFAFASEFEGEIPGAKPEECGNYSDQDLDGAKKYAKKYLFELENYRLEY
ncbi:MAG: S-ribosylhomocysteine lyase [Clostridia bacterium]|nr:S-ribosylhomocysteine lyase [Clostridia bacterium]